MADVIIELISTLGQFLEGIREFCVNLSGATNMFIGLLAFVTLIVILFWVIKQTFTTIPKTPLTR